MGNDITVFVGLDVHKESIAIAVAHAGREAPRFVGTVGPSLAELLKALRRLGDPQHVLLAYEAGPCGFALARRLIAAGWRCQAVRDVAWRAQLRLCGRYRRLSARGMNSNTVCVAIARELAGFVWEAARHVQPAH